MNLSLIVLISAGPEKTIFQSVAKLTWLAMLVISWKETPISELCMKILVWKLADIMTMGLFPLALITCFMPMR